MASTSVVLPWSTCAMMAILRMLKLKKDHSRKVATTTLLCGMGKALGKTQSLKTRYQELVFLRTALFEGSVDSSAALLLPASAWVLRRAKSAVLRMTSVERRTLDQFASDIHAALNSHPQSVPQHNRRQREQ